MKNGEGKPVAIVLGGTVPHIELVKQLKERLYYVILADYLPNPPAKLHADEHIQVSTLDKEAVLRLAIEKNASLVISTCIDHANTSACFVSENLSLPHPYSYDTAVQVTNKILMKKKMKWNGIPTSAFIVVDSDTSDNESLTGLKMPVIVKPADSNSSKGITRVGHTSQYAKAKETALYASKLKQALVEEYIEGVEIGVDCFVSSDETYVLMVKERRKIPNLEGVQQIYGCFWPMPGYEKLLPKVSRIASNIAKTFGLRNTPLMIQAVVRDDEVFVIEFAPRIGGGESFRIIKAATGFDVISAAIDSWEQKRVQVIHGKPNHYYAENFIYAKAGNFGHIYIRDHAKLMEIVEYLDEYKCSGSVIGNELTSNNRVGVFVVKGNYIETVKEKIRRAIECLDVLDTDGGSVFQRDLYQ